MSEHEREWRIAEIFGPTLQGEGTNVGKKTMFVRFGGCDYRCTWCDSMHAVDPEQVAHLPKMTAEEIVGRLDELNQDHKQRLARWVTFSGGNPALFNLMPLAGMLKVKGYALQAETQGTVWNDWLVLCNRLCVSPKPPSAGNITSVDTLKEFFSHLPRPFDPQKIDIKVVVFTKTDLAYASNIFDRFAHLGGKFISVGTPIGATLSEVSDCYRQVAEWVCETPSFKDVAVFPQQHVIAWGHEKGR